MSKPCPMISTAAIHDAVDACVRRSNARLMAERHSAVEAKHLTLRRAVADDALTISRLVRELAAYEKESDAANVGPETYRRNGFRQYPLFHCILVEDGSGAADPASAVAFSLWYIGYSTWEGPFLYLEDLFVQDRYRDREVENMLMYTTAEIAASLGCRRFVWQALDWNTPALDFYASIGSKALNGVLTLRLDREAMASFLQTQSQSHQQEHVSDLAESVLDGEKACNDLYPKVICNAIDRCIARNKPMLTRSSQGNFFRLRRATGEDSGIILELVQKLADNVQEPNAVRSSSATYIRDGFGDFPLFHCLILENMDGSVPIACGIATYYFGFSTRSGKFLYLDDLYIEEDFRGHGGGKCIMYTLTDIAKTLDCARVVWQALDWNARGLRFYESIGAEVLNGCVTLRLDHEAMTSFLGTARNEDDSA